jgi:hypothetical protein
MTALPLRSLYRALTALAVAAAAGCASAPPPAAEGASAAATPTAAGAVVDSFGVRLVGAKLSANGYLVDVRYQVLDPAKARPLLDRSLRPVLIDAATGNRYYVPTPPIVGALRQTARNNVVHADRTYFMLFANPDRRLQPGAAVTLYVGDQKFADLRVDAL